jgi:hypothetical protein
MLRSDRGLRVGSVLAFVFAPLKWSDCMDSKSMTRKDFFVLTFSLVGSAVVASNCSSSNGGGGTGGASGTGGKDGGTGGVTGTGGSGTGGSGTGGRDGGGDVPVNNDSGGDTGTTCSLPLPEEQIVVVTGAGGDTNSHVHSVVVDGTILGSTTDQTFNTGTANNHVHMVTLTAAQLATLRAGGMVTIRSTNTGASDGGADGGGSAGHTHSYLVSCHAIPDAATDTGPADATVG